MFQIGTLLNFTQRTQVGTRTFYNTPSQPKENSSTDGL